MQKLLRKTKRGSFRIISKFIVVVFATVILSFCIQKNQVEAATLIPDENQKIEFRATELKKINDTTQLIVEVWVQNLNFKVIDLKIQHDSILQTSDMTTNAVIDVNDALDLPSNYTFANGFDSYMDLLLISSTEGELRFVYAIMGSDEITGTNNYFKQDDTIGNYISVTDAVLLGKLSFKVGEGEINENTISLKTGTTSPTTGVKVSITETDNYQEPSMFEFIVQLASKDAYLNDLILSTGSVNEQNPEESTYKKYELTPTFMKENFVYEVTLLEYIDIMNVTAIKSDEKATMKIKVPKRNENNELIYDIDGTSIVYEEKEILDNTPLEVTLNKLGEPNTNIGITVTAEDNKIVNQYLIVIKRPSATIKGQIETPNTSKTTGKNEASILAYNNSKVKDVLNWDEQINATNNVNNILKDIPEDTKVITNDDGTFEIKLIPGTYDILIDKPGYVEGIYIYLELKENETIDLGFKSLVAGDTDKNGIVNNNDIISLYQNNNMSEGDEKYDLKFDLDNDKKINNNDIIIAYQNNGAKRIIEDYRGR